MSFDTESLSGYSFMFFVVAFTYVILAVQVIRGFPPLYKRLEIHGLFGRSNPQYTDEMAEIFDAIVLPIIGTIVAGILFITTGFPLSFLIAGILFAWAGIRLRRYLRKTTKGPLPWIIHTPLPWFVKTWAFKSPLLLFDVWTLTFSLGFALLIML